MFTILGLSIWNCCWVPCIRRESHQWIQYSLRVSVRKFQLRIMHIWYLHKHLYSNYVATWKQYSCLQQVSWPLGYLWLLWCEPFNGKFIQCNDCKSQSKASCLSKLPVHVLACCFIWVTSCLNLHIGSAHHCFSRTSFPSWDTVFHSLLPTLNDWTGTKHTIFDTILHLH